MSRPPAAYELALAIVIVIACAVLAWVLPAGPISTAAAICILTFAGVALTLVIAAYLVMHAPLIEDDE